MTMILTLPTEHERQAMIQRANAISAKYDVNKDDLRVADRFCLSPTELTKRRENNTLLLKAINQQMSIMSELLVESSYAMSIADREGYILEVCGNERMLAYYESRNCTPGYQWTLETVGTSSMAMALYEKKPIVLAPTESWPYVSWEYVNAASPVFDHKNELIGTISMTGPKETMQSHTIGLLVQAAANVQLQFHEASKVKETQIRNHFLDCLIEADMRGVVALDTNGVILHMNNKAAMLLKVSTHPTFIASPDEELPKHIDDVLGSEYKIAPLVKSGSTLAGRETLCTIDGFTFRFMLSLTPIRAAGQKALGALLHMTERQQIINIVNTVSGLHPTHTFNSLIGKSASFKEAVRVAKIVAKSNAPVLIQGETGTGKELFAQAIHNASPRASGVFMAINCGAIPRDLLESELFGYEGAAFTGAQKGGRPGKLELAHGGTLFLDEIGDMPFDMQVKLLRVLNSGEIQRIGGRKSILLDLRIITATNVDLYESVNTNSFREDLYYRINTFHIQVPPLRHRKGDILHLAQFFLDNMKSENELSFSPRAMLFMEHYPWLGNVREMQSAVERGARLCTGTFIEPEDLFTTIQHEKHAQAPQVQAAVSHKPVNRKERELAEIEHYMNLYNNNVTAVAKALQVSRITIYRKLKLIEASKGNY